MASPSPPKPWERGGTTASAGLSSSSSPNNPSATSAPPATSANSSSSSGPPALPQRPNTLNSVVNRTASTYSPYGTNRLGPSPYGGVGGYSSYSSPYSRFGGMGGSMYGGMGGMGGYGGMYGGIGGMGGMGGMYGGMGGQVDPNDPNSLTNSFGQSTQATFQIIESIVGAVGGFAQMLDSTYMATHSSFFAMVSVAEQFGNLRNTLGSILGIFTLMRWLRTLLAKLTGRPPPADAMALTPSAFAAFQGFSPTTGPEGSSLRPKPSKKPFIIFLLAVFGLPYLMGKFIRALARSQDEEERQRRMAMIGPNGEPLPQLDASKLEFCRLLYDFSPETATSGGGGAVEGVDLAVKKGDLIAVLSKSDPMGNASEWWRCRARDGRVGYLPSPYLESIQRRVETKAITGASAGADADGSRTASMVTTGKEVGGAKGEAADISVEGFQKSQFYS